MWTDCSLSCSCSLGDSLHSYPECNVIAVVAVAIDVFRLTVCLFAPVSPTTKEVPEIMEPDALCLLAKWLCAAPY